MILIILLDLLAAVWLTALAASKGFEEALPTAAFLLLLFPSEAQLQLPGLFSLTIQRVIVLVLIALWLGRRNNTLNRSGAWPLTYLIVFIAAWMLLSTANSVIPSISFKSTLSQLLDFFAVYFIFSTSISKSDTIERIMTALVASMFLCSILGIVEACTGWSVISLFPSLPSRFSDLGSGVNDRGARIQSTFSHAILFGSTLAMSIPLAFYLLQKAQTVTRRNWLWASLLAMMFCIYKTGSRGPWLALLLALSFLFFVSGTATRKHLSLLALLALAVLLTRPGIFTSLSNMYTATRDPTSPEGQSYQWRYMLYNVAERELSKDAGRALWGYGPESFYYLNLTAPFLVDGEVKTVKVQSCDSAIVEIAMDTGCVGLLSILALFAKAAFTALQQCIRRNDSTRFLPSVLLITLGTFCFMMTNVEIYAWGQQNYMLWIIIACIFVYPVLPVSEAENQEASPTDSIRTPALVFRSAAIPISNIGRFRRF